MCGFDVDNFSSIATSDCAELPTSLMREVIYIMLARFLLSFLMEVLCICFYVANLFRSTTGTFVVRRWNFWRTFTL